MRKTFTRFFTIADYEEEEMWLRKQHQSGWKLAKMTFPCFYTFESCEPEDVIYRLDYKNSGQTSDYMQMAEDFGWEYFDQFMGWLYFRKPASSAETEEDGELFSDNESRVSLVSHVVKTRFLSLCVVFLCCVIPNLFRVFSRGFGVFDMVFSIFWIIMFALYVYLITYCGIKLKKIRSRYEQIQG